MFRYILNLLNPKRFARPKPRHHSKVSVELELQSHDSDGHFPLGTPF